MDENPPPLLMPLRAFLRDVGRSYVWYRDNVDNAAFDPPLPRLIKQGVSNFVTTRDAQRYTRLLLRKAGIATAGRPRKRELTHPES